MLWCSENWEELRGYRHGDSKIGRSLEVVAVVIMEFGKSLGVVTVVIMELGTD